MSCLSCVLMICFLMGGISSVERLVVVCHYFPFKELLWGVDSLDFWFFHVGIGWLIGW